MILHIPHSSAKMPENVIVTKEMADEINVITDWYVNELFTANTVALGSILEFPFSRIICDVERFRHDPLEKIGRGFIYKKLLAGADLSTGFPEAESIKLYEQHHARLHDVVNKILPYTRAFIVDCHSFNDMPLPYEEKGERPDFCIGVDNFHTPAFVVDELIKLIKEHELTVKINTPYSGTMVPAGFMGHMDVKSVMIEVNKRLYLNDDFSRGRNFNETKTIIEKLLRYIDKVQDDEMGDL